MASLPVPQQESPASSSTTAEGNRNGNGNSSAITTDPNFTSDFFSSIANAHSNDNVIVSPLLLEAMLTLLYLGSDGTTALELERTLQLKRRFPSNAKMANYYAAHIQLATLMDGVETGMQLCSQLLVSAAYSVADEFQKIAQKYFHTAAIAELQQSITQRTQLQAHFNECLAQTAHDQTWSVVDEALLPQQLVEPTAALFFIAANFKSKWFLPFSAYRTGIYDFQLPASAGATTENGEACTAAAASVPVPMLFDDDMFVKFGEFRELDARAIELPYEHDENEMSMLLVLPNQRDGLTTLERRLHTVDLGALMERMQMESVQVLVPKFRIDYECSLRTCLEQLGISTMFTKEANFRNLLHEKCTETLQIADVLHKVRIEVNESGTEGSNGMTYKPIVISNSINGRHKFFRADHPFFFAIRARDVTYFAGHVAKF